MTTKQKRVALYLRVSTSEQTTENQQQDLERWAERAGHKIVAIYQDQGISGAKGRDKRPGLDALMRAAAKREFDMVATWAIDRLGRSLSKVVRLVEELDELGIAQFHLQQGIDTTTASGKALIGMATVFAEFERSLTVERIKAGHDRARAQGKTMGRPVGWRATKIKREDEIRKCLKAGLGKRETARTLGVALNTVLKAGKKMEAEKQS